MLEDINVISMHMLYYNKKKQNAIIVHKPMYLLLYAL